MLSKQTSVLLAESTPTLLLKSGHWVKERKNKEHIWKNVTCLVLSLCLLFLFEFKGTSLLAMSTFNVLVCIHTILAHIPVIHLHYIPSPSPNANLKKKSGKQDVYVENGGCNSHLSIVALSFVFLLITLSLLSLMQLGC